MSGVRGFLSESSAASRRSDLHRGLAYTAPDKSVTTLAAVEEYIGGFGAYGVGAREVVTAVQRDERGVKRALQALVEDGKLRIVEQATRGPRASRRKVYHPTRLQSPVIVSMPEFADDYGLLAERLDNEHGAGGGRAIGPKRVEY